MKNQITAILMLLGAVLLLAGCLTLKPFTQDELDRISSVPASVLCV